MGRGLHRFRFAILAAVAFGGCIQAPVALEVTLPENGRPGRFTTWALRALDDIPSRDNAFAIVGTSSADQSRVTVDLATGEFADLEAFSAFGIRFTRYGGIVKVTIPLDSKSPLAKLYDAGLQRRAWNRLPDRSESRPAEVEPFAFVLCIQSGSPMRLDPEYVTSPFARIEITDGFAAAAADAGRELRILLRRECFEGEDRPGALVVPIKIGAK